jgi:hypothetical protein
MTHGPVKNSVAYTYTALDWPSAVQAISMTLVPRVVAFAAVGVAGTMVPAGESVGIPKLPSVIGTNGPPDGPIAGVKTTVLPGPSPPLVAARIAGMVPVAVAGT